MGVGFIFYKIEGGGFIFYKILKIFRVLRAGGFITKSTAKINLFWNVFWTVSTLITAKNPENFRALRAHDFWGPKKKSRASRGRFYYFIKSRFDFLQNRGGGFIFYSGNFDSGRFHGGEVNSNSSVLVGQPLVSLYST